MILDTASGRIEPNWSVRRDTAFFSVIAPYPDGLPGPPAILGRFNYLPHAELAARAPQLAQTLENFLNMYVTLVNSGDCGNWDPETDAEVIAARAVLADVA